MSLRSRLMERAERDSHPLLLTYLALDAMLPGLAKTVLEPVRSLHCEVQPLMQASLCHHHDGHREALNADRERLCMDTPMGPTVCGECNRPWPCPTVQLCDQIAAEVLP